MSASVILKWPVSQIWRHSAADASRLAALLLRQIFPISSVVAPCQPGASAPSVRRHIYEMGHLGSSFARNWFIAMAVQRHALGFQNHARLQAGQRGIDDIA